MPSSPGCPGCVACPGCARLPARHRLGISPRCRRPLPDRQFGGEGLLVRAGCASWSAEPQSGLFKQHLVGLLKTSRQSTLRQLGLDLVIVGGGQNRSQGVPGHVRIRDPFRVLLDQLPGTRLQLGGELVGVVVAEQCGVCVLVPPRPAGPMYADDQGLEVRVEQARAAAIVRLGRHCAYPAVVLPDRRRNVTHPAVTAEKHVGDAVANGPGQFLAEQAPVLLTAFGAVAVEQHQVIVEIGPVDVA